jgi:signal transduction histidine kinase
VLAVTDDGAGFEANGDGAGQGLQNMRRRAASIDGSLALRSRPGHGTAVEVVLRS